MRVKFISDDPKYIGFMTVDKIYDVYEVKEQDFSRKIPKKAYTVCGEQGFYSVNADCFETVEE